MNQHERKHAKQIGEILKKRFKKIYIGRKPSSSKNFRDRVEKELGHKYLLQPDLDLVFKDGGDLNAVELKSFTPKEFNKNMRFYRGIGQALALFRYGFDHVALWHVLSDDIPDAQINIYGAQTWYFIRNQLSLEVDFTYIKVSSDSKYKVMQYTSEATGFELSDIDNPGFSIKWRHSNPLLKREDTKEDVRKIRNILEKWLNNCHA